MNYVCAKLYVRDKLRAFKLYVCVYQTVCVVCLCCVYVL
jgi:hypothetical protein